MMIVAGHIGVEPEQRESYLVGCRAVVEHARSAPGCLDFAITGESDGFGTLPAREPSHNPTVGRAVIATGRSR